MLSTDFSMQFFPAAQDLQPFVKDFIAVSDRRPIGIAGERFLPDGNFMLVINLENGYLTKNAEHSSSIQEVAKGYLHTHQQRAYYLHRNGDYRGIVVHFTPEGMYHLLHSSLSELPLNAVFEVETLFGKWSKNLVEQLLEYASPAQQVAYLEQIFRKKLSITGLNDKTIPNLIQWINKLHGNISVEEIAQKAHTSRKTLERHFQQRVGLNPKQYLRTIRLRRAYTQLCMGQPNDIMDLVLDNGFYDQTHLIKEFKRFIGLTPTGLLKSPDFSTQSYHTLYRSLESKF
ncbi:MAG: AraC family transcriptional regulator [Saprospiraceae bacterium]|nr:AraC family transcriptional regulator [Saprospiraceae bacterium]